MSELFVQSGALHAVPGIRHAFSTRRGGTSRGAFASLNLGFGGDDARAVEANRARLRAAANLDGPWVQVQQVHGTTVVDADDVGPRTEADAIIVRRPGVFAAVRTADCVPVLVAAIGDGGRAVAVAAAHAGWRGATAGIGPALVRQLDALGHPPHRLRVALGPSISALHFEVGPEVIEAARDALGGREPPTRPGRRGRPHLDLPRLVRWQLEAVGVEIIDVSTACTYRDADAFFSHRRQRGRCGRHLSLVGFSE